MRSRRRGTLVLKSLSSASTAARRLASFLDRASPVKIPMGAPWGRKWRGGGGEEGEKKVSYLPGDELCLALLAQCEGALEELGGRRVASLTELVLYLGTGPGQGARAKYNMFFSPIFLSSFSLVLIFSLRLCLSLTLVSR